MDFITYVGLNAPLVLASLLVNLFFVYCLVVPATSEKLKQPLKLLLETVVSCSVLYLLCLICEATTWHAESKHIANLIFYLSSLCVVSTSMTASAWLSFFYYAKIVPAKRAASVWIKKNVKLVVYSAWVFERLWTLCNLSFLAVQVYPVFLTNTSLEELQKVQKVYIIPLSFLKSYFLLSICVMLMSNASISLYLSSHIKRMTTSGESFSGPKFYAQLRVAVSGMVQGLLYLLCAAWIAYAFFYEQLNTELVDSSLHVTLINVYVFGTTLNLWLGQSVFRQRTFDLINALKTCGRR